MIKSIRFLLAGFFCFFSLSCSASSTLIQPSIEQKIDVLISQMTLEQKIAQMIQGEIKDVKPEDVRIYGLGSVLNGGGSFPNDDKHSAVSDWLALADKYFIASKDTEAGSAGIPIIWGTDAVHGHNNVIGATLFPHNIGLGAANDPELMYKIGSITANEVAATGIDWVFAPTVAVVKDDRWGRTYEGYSDRGAIVADYASQMVRGIQSTSVVATAKHFIGDGGTYRGVDQGNTVLPLDELLQQHGSGYIEAIDAGVLTVMASFNSWNGEKIHGHKQLLTDVLKDDMGFQGFVISDWNGIGQVEGCSNDSCPQAINAGVDMVMAPNDWKALLNNMVNEVNSGIISEARINDAVRRILRVKFLSGLMDADRPSERKAAKNQDVVGSEKHRQIAREAVRKSLVLLKNNDNLLPLNPNQQVMVTGSGADDIGVQSGGWTISWQGTGNENSDFPGATSIYQGIASAVKSAGGKVILSSDGIVEEKPDVAIVVFGEKPYAEGKGDLLSLMMGKAHHKDLKLLKQLQSQNIPVVSVFLTGRPMWVNREINSSNAFVVAWLPGSEGGGVADVLFADVTGKARYDFEGRLSFDWPAEDLNEEDHHLPVRKNLFSYGFGLNYQSETENLMPLNEQKIGFAESRDVIVFKRGTNQPWVNYLGDEFNWSLEVLKSRSSSEGNVVKIATKDFEVQEDVRQVTWRGDTDRDGQVYWQAEDPIDLTPLKNADGALSVLLRLDQPLQGQAEIRMDCGWPCHGAINIDTALSSMQVDDWSRFSIPLNCFMDKGLNINKVNTPFVLSVNGSLQVTIAEVALLEHPPVESLLSCHVND